MTVNLFNPAIGRKEDYILINLVKLPSLDSLYEIFAYEIIEDNPEKFPTLLQLLRIGARLHINTELYSDSILLSGKTKEKVIKEWEILRREIKQKESRFLKDNLPLLEDLYESFPPEKERLSKLDLKINYYIQQYAYKHPIIISYKGMKRYESVLYHPVINKSGLRWFWLLSHDVRKSIIDKSKEKNLFIYPHFLDDKLVNKFDIYYDEWEVVNQTFEEFKGKEKTIKFPKEKVFLLLSAKEILIFNNEIIDELYKKTNLRLHVKHKNIYEEIEKKDELLENLNQKLLHYLNIKEYFSYDIANIINYLMIARNLKQDFKKVIAYSSKFLDKKHNRIKIIDELLSNSFLDTTTNKIYVYRMKLMFSHILNFIDSKEEVLSVVKNKKLIPQIIFEVEAYKKGIITKEEASGMTQYSRILKKLYPENIDTKIK